jgi:uncharacterized PurR-regulated membrane protein YhhQ (DUF165 family)
VGQGLDSSVFVTVVFLGTRAGPDLLRPVMTGWLVESAYEAVATPFTDVVVKASKRAEGMGNCDHGVRCAPFPLD